MHIILLNKNSSGGNTQNDWLPRNRPQTSQIIPSIIARDNFRDDYSIQEMLLIRFAIWLKVANRTPKKRLRSPTII